MADRAKPEAPRDLAENIATEILALMHKAFVLANRGDAREGEACMQRAWQMVPEPKLGWDMSMLIVREMSGFYRSIGDYAQAHKWADLHLSFDHLPGDGAPFILKGSIFYEQGDMKSAREWLKRGLKVGKRRAFKAFDPKYLELATAE